MAKSYLVSFTPLEPYTFADETIFNGSVKFESVSNGLSTYYMKSKLLPEPTTLFGTLRYLVLFASGNLKHDFYYNDDEKKRIAEVIGSESFSFENNLQEFGYIKKVSPMFITEGNNLKKIILKNPFCNKSTGESIKKFTPMAMCEIESSISGVSHLPNGEDEYNAKKGYCSNFVELREGTISNAPDGLFSKEVITGNAVQENDNGFFKRETVMLKEGYSISVIVTVDDSCDLAIVNGSPVFMGKKCSAFRVDIADNVAPSKLDETLINTFSGNGDWYYAISDVRLPSSYKYKDFAIVETKSIRNLETNYSKQNQKDKLKRSNIQFNIVTAGSVFFGFNPNDSLTEAELKHLQQIGYNYIIQLGGGK